MKGRRKYWLDGLIKEHNFKLGAEIGVASGKTTKYLLQNNPKLRLYAVDLWGSNLGVLGERELNLHKKQDHVKWKSNFYRNINDVSNRVSIIQEISWEAAGRVDDDSLDFVFIDADHSFESVKRDINAWLLKVKCGGIICGHDINLPGVAKAVNLYFPNSWINVGVDNCWMVKI